MKNTLSEIKNIMSRIDESYRQYKTIINEDSHTTLIDRIARYLFWTPSHMELRYQTINLTNEIRQYIKLEDNKDILNGELSIEASELHNKIMSVMWGNNRAHEYMDCRKAFAKIVHAIYHWMPQSEFYIFIYGDDRQWVCVKSNSGDEPFFLYGEANSFEGEQAEIHNGGCGLEMDVSYAIAYEGRLFDGVNLGEVDYRPGSCNGGSGYHHNPKTTTMKKEYADKIRKMGLVPCVLEKGSYHENFFNVLGIIPQLWPEFKKQNPDVITTET